jgi:predicted RNA polymerase sigma factor
VLAALPRRRLGPYQLQAAIAAVHDEAASHEETDWAEILGLYELLMHVSPSPAVSLNHAVAVAMVHGPAAGLDRLANLDTDGALAETHRVDATRGHLLELAGDCDGALAAYQRAAARTLNRPERRYLQLRAARLRQGPTQHAGG